VTKAEVLRAHEIELLDTMMDKYEQVLHSEGRVQYAIYIWEDGEIQCLEQAQGDNSYLQPRDNESRELYYVTTVGGQYVYLWDCSEVPPPDDSEERKEMENEIVGWLMDEYRDTVDYVLDDIIAEAAWEEEEA